MRIKAENIIILKDIFLKHFNDSKLYLFGSRTDDSKKGGDIDLLILSQEKYSIKEISSFRYELLKLFGDRKIDILNYRFSDNSLFLFSIIDGAIEL